MHTPLFSKKDMILMDVSLSVGEFDPSADGAYRNVKTFPLEVMQGKELFVSVDSDAPVDIAISGGDGMCIIFRESILNGKLGPIAVRKKETMMLVIGVFRGDRAELKLKVWTE